MELKIQSGRERCHRSNFRCGVLNPRGRQRDCCLIETNLPDLFVAGGAGRGPIKRGALWQAGALWPSNLRINT